MRPVLYTIARPGGGTLSTMARPRGGDWLSGEFAELAAAGVGVVVSMLAVTEAAELGLGQESGEAAAAGIEFHQVPTPDRRPPDLAATSAMAAKLAGRLAAGASVAVHCRFGIGRSSTLAAAVLVAEGVKPADAWDLISAARGLPVPDTAEQREFLHRLTASG